MAPSSTRLAGAASRSTRPRSLLETLIGVPGIETTSFVFRTKLDAMCTRVEVITDDMVVVMGFESDHTFSAGKRNPFSGAVGLIQFIEPTANHLGTTCQALSEMTSEDQLDYVEKYFAPFRGLLKGLADTYFAVFSPVGIGKPQDHVLYRDPSKAYAQNVKFDREKKGFITCGDVVRTIRELQLYSLSRPRVPICSPENPYA